MTRWYARPILPVADVTVALSYYISALGFREDWRHEVDGRLLVAQVSGEACELILSCQWPDKAGQSMQFISLGHDALIALRDDLEARGVPVLDGEWGYRLMILDDPDGNQLLFPYPSEANL
jgi:catechol 2,3-dioxygenase-like lactoylglutathione lyase family enzyme